MISVHLKKIETSCNKLKNIKSISKLWTLHRFLWSQSFHFSKFPFVWFQVWMLMMKVIIWWSRTKYENCLTLNLYTIIYVVLL